MSLDRKKRAKNAQLTKSEWSGKTGTLDGVTTVEIVHFNMVGSKATVQSSGSLAGNIEFSLDGENWTSSTAFTATGFVSFSTHNFSSAKVTRTGGSGKLSIAVR